MTDPVVIPVTLDTSKAVGLLRTLKQEIISSIKGGFQEGGQQAATAGLADSIKKLTEAFKEAALEGKKLETAVTAKANAERNAQAATDAAANAERQRVSALAASFASVLRGTTAEQRFTQELLKTAASAGAGIGTLTQLASATDVFTQEQIDAAAKVALLENAYTRLVKGLATGETTVEQLAEATKELARENANLERSLKNVSATQEQVNQSRAKGFVNALSLKNAEQQVTVELLRQAQAADNTREQLERIALASGAFSAQEVKLANEISELSSRFDVLSAKINRTEQEERELAGVTQQLSAALAEQSGKAQTGVRSFGELQIAFAKFNNVMAVVRNVVNIVTGTLGTLYETARQGAVIDQTTQSFSRFASEVVGIPDLLEQASEAAKGTISDFELASQTLTLISGLTPDVAKTFSEALVGAGDFSTSLLDVARAAQILNPALGDMDFFLRSLSIGIKRNERRWIDNLGIVISARESYQRYSEETGKSVLALTAQDKQLATLNETLRVGQLLIDQVGDSVSSQVDTFARFETSWENLTNKISVAIKDAILPYLQLINGEFSPSVDNATNSLLEFNRQLIDQKELEISEGLFDYGQLSESERQIEAIKNTLRDVRDLRDEPPVSLEDFLFGISDRELESQIGNLARLLGEEVSDKDQFKGILQGIFEGEEIGLAKGIIDELERSGAVSRQEAAALAQGAGIDVLIEKLFNLVNTEKIASRETGILADVVRRIQTESANASERVRDLVVALESIADDALEKQLGIIEEFDDALDDAGRNKALDKLSSSFVDLGSESFNALGLGEIALLNFRVAIGDLSQESADLRSETILLNNEINSLFVLFGKEGVTDTKTIADAFDILRLGLADTAEEALLLANNEAFVAGELENTRENAKAAGEELDDLAQSTEDVAKATEDLRKKLGDIVESGFGKARQAILDYGEAQRGIIDASGEFKTVTINNAGRIAEINKKLFGDLDKDTRESLENRLKELRESGQDVSQEYANILDELDNALSRSERDTLIKELFDLQGEQGKVVSGIFGADREALKGFEQDAQDAIQELINARRETIVGLFAEGREIDFETEVDLLLEFNLIDTLEADLLVKERQIFDVINSVFGAGSVIRIDAETTIDFGEILLGELGVEGVAGLTEQIERLIGELGLGQEVQEAINIGLNLVLQGDLDTGNLDEFFVDVLGGLERGEPLGVAVAVALTPEIDNAQTFSNIVKELSSNLQIPADDRAQLEQIVQDFLDSLFKVAPGITEEGSTLKRNLLIDLSTNLPLDPDEIAELKNINSAFLDAQTNAQNLRQEVKGFVEEPEKKEIEIVAETDEAERLIQEFLDSIPEKIFIELGIDGGGVDFGTGFRTPPSSNYIPPAVPQSLDGSGGGGIGDAVANLFDNTPSLSTFSTTGDTNNNTSTTNNDRSTTIINNYNVFNGNDTRPVPDYFA